MDDDGAGLAQQLQGGPAEQHGQQAAAFQRHAVQPEVHHLLEEIVSPGQAEAELGNAAEQHHQGQQLPDPAMYLSMLLFQGGHDGDVDEQRTQAVAHRAADAPQQVVERAPDPGPVKNAQGHQENAQYK